MGPDRKRLGDEIRSRLHRPLPLWLRLILFFLGGALVVIGVAGLALPGIQGILTILAGIAVLSVASETAYRLLHRLLHRWPGLWERIDRFRHKVHDRLSKKH